MGCKAIANALNARGASTGDTFDRRKALAAERRFDVHTSPGHKVHYLLSRLIVCDVCGNHFGGRRLLQKEKDGSTTERFAYYCGGYLNKGTSVCASLPIPKHWLEGVVLKLLRARLCEPEALAELEEKVRKRIDGIRREYGSDSRVLDQKLADLERRIQNYYAAIGDGLDPAVCRAKIAELTAKKEELEREVALVQREDFLRKALERNLAEVRRFSAVFEDQFESLPFERKRQVVLHFVEKIEVVERRLIRITFQVPFDNTGLKHLVDDIVTPGADTPETETVKMPTIPDGSDSRNGGVRGAIPRADLTGRHRS
jgi:site-specific DNA recombinase